MRTWGDGVRRGGGHAEDNWPDCLRLGRELAATGPDGAELRHRYREVLLGDGPSLAERPLRVLVLGAGIAGLCAAYALRRGGHDVHVVEADPDRIGGRLAASTCSPFHDPPLHADAGGVSIPDTHPLTLSLVDGLGLRRRPAVPAAVPAGYTAVDLLDAVLDAVREYHTADTPDGRLVGWARLVHDLDRLSLGRFLTEWAGLDATAVSAIGRLEHAGYRMSMSAVVGVHGGRLAARARGARARALRPVRPGAEPAGEPLGRHQPRGLVSGRAGAGPVPGSDGGVVLASHARAGGAVRWEAMEPDDRYARALRGLQEVYGDRIEAFCTGRGATGSWETGEAVLAPGQLTAHHLAAVAPVGPLHFAGEHTSLRRSSIEGAIESGVRAALALDDQHRLAPVREPVCGGAHR
jgi:Flavin containing amine oxidoreductase